jgi:hypothetical protein
MSAQAERAMMSTTFPIILEPIEHLGQLACEVFVAGQRKRAPVPRTTHRVPTRVERKEGPLDIPIASAADVPSRDHASCGTVITSLSRMAF